MSKKSRLASGGKKSVEKTGTENKAEDSASEPKKAGEIRIQETEEDHVLGSGFSGDPDEFKDEIKKEAEKSDVFSKFILPLLVFIVMAVISAGLIWYYARPEKTVPNTEDKIQTPPKVETKPAENTTPSPAPTTAPVPEKKETNYTVKEGDTLSSIANANGMSSTELATYNGITDANSLHIGQVLKIPTK